MAERQRGERLNYRAYFSSPLFRQGPRESRRFYLWRYALMGFAAPELFFPLYDIEWEIVPIGEKTRKGMKKNRVEVVVSLYELLRAKNMYIAGTKDDPLGEPLMRDGPLGTVGMEEADDEFGPLLRRASLSAKAIWDIVEPHRGDPAYRERLDAVEQMVSNKFYKMPSPVSARPDSAFMTFIECVTRYYDVHTQNPPNIRMLEALHDTIHGRGLTYADMFEHFEYVSQCVAAACTVTAGSAFYRRYLTRAAAIAVLAFFDPEAPVNVPFPHESRLAEMCPVRPDCTGIYDAPTISLKSGLDFAISALVFHRKHEREKYTMYYPVYKETKVSRGLSSQITHIIKAVGTVRNTVAHMRRLDDAGIAVPRGPPRAIFGIAPALDSPQFVPRRAAEPPVITTPPAKASSSSSGAAPTTLPSSPPRASYVPPGQTPIPDSSSSYGYVPPGQTVLPTSSSSYGYVPPGQAVPPTSSSSAGFVLPPAPMQPRPKQHAKPVVVAESPGTGISKSAKRTPPTSPPKTKRTAASPTSPFAALAGASQLAGLNSNMSTDSRLQAAAAMTLLDSSPAAATPMAARDRAWRTSFAGLFDVTPDPDALPPIERGSAFATPEDTRHPWSSPEEPFGKQIGACRKRRPVNIMADLELAMRQMGLGF